MVGAAAAPAPELAAIPHEGLKAALTRLHALRAALPAA
jgi:hypothetical protein